MDIDVVFDADADTDATRLMMKMLMMMSSFCLGVVSLRFNAVVVVVASGILSHLENHISDTTDDDNQG